MPKTHTIKFAEGGACTVEIPAGWTVVKSGRTKPGDRFWNNHQNRWSYTTAREGFSVDFYYCIIREIRVIRG